MATNWSRPINSMSKQRGELEQSIGERICFARKRRDVVLRQGDVYKPYVDGTPPEALDNETETDHSSTKREEIAMGSGWRMTSVPAHGMLRQVLLPSLVSRPPKFLNRGTQLPPNPDPQVLATAELKRRRGEIMAKLADVIYREYGVQLDVLAAVDDALPYTVGWLEVDFDRERKLPRIRWQSAKCVTVDCETEYDPFGRAHRWRAVHWTMAHEDAKILADEWGAKGYEFHPITERVDDDNDISAEGAPTPVVRLVRVYVKGDNPHLSHGNIAAGNGSAVEKTGEDEVYTGKNEILLLEETGGGKEHEEFKLVARRPWPFPVDTDDFPLEPVRLTNCNDSFYPPSLYQSGHSLQVALNWAMRYYNTDCMNSSRRVVGYLEGALDKNKVQEVLYGTENLPAIGFKNQSDMERVLKIMNFGQPSPALRDSIAGNHSMYREVTGLTAFDAEARSHTTATDAAIRNEGAQLRMGAMAERVERAIVGAMRKALMCAQWLMTGSDVARWIGEEYMGFETVVDGTTEVLKSPYWPEDPTEDDIRREVGIDIEPRSVRFVSPEQEVNDIERLVGKTLELARAVSDANQQNPTLAAAIARAGNEALRAFAERLHVPNPEAMIIDLTAALTPPMPEPQQAGMGGAPSQPPAASPQDMVNGPAASELAGLIPSLGLNPANVPGQLGAQMTQRMG